jgi:hypothetical protein
MRRTEAYERSRFERCLGIDLYCGLLTGGEASRLLDLLENDHSVQYLWDQRDACMKPRQRARFALLGFVSLLLVVITLWT